MKTFYVRMNEVREIGIEIEAETEMEALDEMWKRYKSVDFPEDFNVSTWCEYVDTISIEEVGQDLADTEEKEFGVFEYSEREDDQCVMMVYFNTEEAAVNFAKNHIRLAPDGYFVEVWQRDSLGLFGNSGRPIWKSDEETE